MSPIPTSSMQKVESDDACLLLAIYTALRSSNRLLVCFLLFMYLAPPAAATIDDWSGLLWRCIQAVIPILLITLLSGHLHATLLACTHIYFDWCMSYAHELYTSYALSHFWSLVRAIPACWYLIGMRIPMHHVADSERWLHTQNPMTNLSQLRVWWWRILWW